ncbi:MAG: hypothetical protein H0Z28_12695 [Archaeoglobus sp.]|nr:hypothetical protein [Archaeoglobus sp.]
MIIDLVGVFIGGIGVVIALYSLYKNRRLETRLKYKDTLKIIGSKVKMIEDKVQYLLDMIELNDPDYSGEILETLPMELIKIHYDSKQNSINTFLVIETTEENNKGENKKKISNVREGVEYIKSGSWIECKIVGLTFHHDFCNPLSAIRLGLKALNELNDEDVKIINEFSPDLLSKLEDTLIETAKIILGSVLKHRQITIDFAKFNTSEELGKWLFNEIVGYEKLKPQLNELKDILHKLEELRKDLLKTSYA